MAVITIKVVVANLDTVLQIFDKIKVYRSISALGPFVEITTPATRMSIEPNVIVYEFTDDSGAPTYYYKSSYFNSVSSLESALSDAQMGEGDAALDIISVDTLKQVYLFGLDLTDDTGKEYPDALYEFFIKSAVSWMEHRLDLPIRTTVVTDERHDYYREDYDKYIWIDLYKYPVLTVEAVRLVLPGDVVVQDFDNDWIHVDKDSGQLQLVPGTGTAGSILLGASGAYIPLIYGNNRRIPDAFRIDYTAGFLPGQVPDVIADIIGKTASFGPLNIAGDLLGGAGIASQSIGIDGLSQSFSTTSSATNAGYGARLIQYSKEIKEVLPRLERYYKGIRMVIG